MTMQKNQKQLQAEDLVFELLAELGQIYLDLGKYDKAVEKLKLLVELDETDALAHLNLSRAYLQKQQYDTDALKIFERALKLNPDESDLADTVTRLFLKEKRSDSDALTVYTKTLRRQKNEEFENLAAEILGILCREKKHQAAHNFINRFRDDEGRFRELVALYLKSVWKNEQFDQADSFLKNLLAEEPKAIWKHLYLTNLWKSITTSPDAAQITALDLEWFKELVNERQVFDSLSDVYLFLSVNRLFQKFPIKADEEHRPTIEEYELFISGDTFSNIWDLGLNKREISGINMGLNDQLLLEKMRRLLEDREGKEDSLEKVMKQANCLFVLKCDQGSLPGLKKSLKMLYDQSKENSRPFLQVFEARDGLIVFGSDIGDLTKAVKKIVNKQEKINETNGKQVSQLEIVINTIGLAKDRFSKYLFDDLETALSLFARDDSFLLAERIPDPEENKALLHVYITESVKNNIAEQMKDISVFPAKLKLVHPASADPIPIYKINVHDALDKIENGALKSIGKFQVNQELHQNQIFSSFRAIDSMLERLVILKVLKPGFEINDDPEMTKKVFQEQARRLGQITHPNVALIYEVGEDHQLQFFAREYVDGKPLSEAVKSGNTFDWKKSLQLGVQLTEILSAIHKKNVIHGKLKPTNIFVLEKMELKLTDFQIKGFGIPVRDMDNVPLQSLTYSAPELLDQYDPSVQTDVYSLGVILYELLTGHNPFLNGSRETVFNNILTRMPNPVSRMNPDVPKKVDKIIFKALEKAPVNRFSNMKSFARELKELL